MYTGDAMSNMDQAKSADSAATVTRKRRRRWPVVLVLIALTGIWFGRFAYLRITMRPTPRPEYWAAQIMALDPPPPGAVPFETVRKLLSDRSWEKGLEAAKSRDFDPTDYLDIDWTDTSPEIHAINAIFESPAFQRDYETLVRYAQVGWRGDVKLPEPEAYYTMSRWGDLYRNWMKWLALHAHWSIVKKKDVNIAIQDWLTILRTARQIRRQRTDDSILLSEAFAGLAAWQMIYASREIHSPIDTRNLVNEIEVALPTIGADELLKGIRLQTLSNLEYMFVREGGGWLDVAAAVKVLCGRQSSRIWNLASPLYHDITQARENVDFQFDDLDRSCVDIISCSREMPNDTLTVLDGSDIQHHPDCMGHTMHLCYRRRSDMEAAIAMMALEQYRLRTGYYPRKLQNLIPDYLPRLPIDYANREPLRYRSNARGWLGLNDPEYVLYSVGKNGRDDGGQGAVRWNSEDVVYSAFKRKAKSE